MTTVTLARVFVVASTMLAIFHAGEVAQAQQPASSTQPVSRPFPIVQVQIGDVPVALPKDWVETKIINISSGERKTVTLVNANLRQSPRSTHFDVPPLIIFDTVGVSTSLVEQNLTSRKAALEKRWPDRAADEDGFWHWQPGAYGEYVLIGASYARPLEQPLIVECTKSLRPGRRGEQRCGVKFYWTPNASVRYDFYDTDVPKSRWAELDQRVLELLKFFDGRQAWPVITPSGK